MKRSEFIKELQDRLYFDGNTYIKVPSQLIDSIVHYAELLGMEPPLREHTPDKLINEWETE